MRVVLQALMLLPLVLGVWSAGVNAQDSTTRVELSQTGSGPNAPAVDSSDDWSLHGQFTFVGQTYPSFTSPYQGQNSLTPTNYNAQTTDLTLFMGRRLWSGAEFFVNPEINQGYGLSNTLGLAGFSSGAAYKLGSTDPYLRVPRAFIRQTINLGGETIDLTDLPNQFAKQITANNVVITAGKFSVVDIFDTNTYAHDPRSDFLNWTGLDAGAFDYAADAWGYTNGVAVEWTQDSWTLRGGFFALSTVPNTTTLDNTFHQFEAVGEFEQRYEIAGRKGKVKLLGFLNRGYMGTYSDAVALARLTGTTPDTANVRQYASRPGAAINWEQEITPTVGVFARASINNGAYEAFEFTDVNQSVMAGVSIKGNSWSRGQDTVGVLQIFNGLSADAQQYFGSGGMGILIGDGKLNYATERISEIYYNMVLSRHLAVALNYQFVVNPAYNRDRGPVNIFGLRLHAEF